MGVWIVLGVIVGLVSGAAARFASAEVAAAVEGLAALAGFVGYDTVLKATDSTFGAGRCNTVLDADRRLACLEETVAGWEGFGAFMLVSIGVGLIVWGLLAALVSGDAGSAGDGATAH